MRRSAPLLFLVLGLCVGCASPRDSAHYGWLRKQGARSVSITPADHPSKTALDKKEADERATADLGNNPDSPVPNVEAHPGGSSVHVQDLTIPTEIRDGSFAINDTLDLQDSSYYNPQDHPWNAKAIASLPIAVGTVVVGLAIQNIYLLLIGGAIAFALGLIASRQCRDRGDRGKGLSVTAMVLGAAALFFSLMVLITAAR